MLTLIVFASRASTADPGAAAFAIIAMVVVAFLLALSGAFKPKTKLVVWRGGLPHCPKCGQQVSLKAARPRCRACGHDLTAADANRVSPETRAAARELLQKVHTLQANMAVTMIQIKANAVKYEWLQGRLKTKLLGPLKYDVYANRLVITRKNLYSIELFPVDDEQFLGWAVKTEPAFHRIVLDPKGPSGHMSTLDISGPFDALATVIAKLDQTIIAAKSSKARPLEAVNIQPNSSLCMTEDQWNTFRELREQAKQQHTFELANQRAEAERLAEQERQARISAARGRLARATGIPTTKCGLGQKVGRLVLGRTLLLAASQ